MLDVHPPTAAIHGWKDFFVHIATITIGLLIAIALEQTVEYLHHLDQLATVRQELSAELSDNRQVMKRNLALLNAVHAKLDIDMVLLRTSQLSHTSLNGKLDYSYDFYRTPDGAWQAAKEKSALGLMPQDELRTNVYIYAVLGAFMDALNGLTDKLDSAAAMTRRGPNGALSPRDIDELVTTTSEAEGKLDFVARMLKYEERGLNLANRNKKPNS
jgi:hypothetical protein